jgi:hypothetical protein
VNKTIQIKILLLVVLVVVVANNSVAAQDSAVPWLENNKWEMIREVSNIDNNVMDILRMEFIKSNKDSRISDPGGAYNHSDVMDGRPRRRLIIAGKSNNKLFVIYERGGLASSIQFIAYEKKNNTIKNVFYGGGTAGKIRSDGNWDIEYRDIIKAFKQGKFRTYVGKERYY